MGDLEDEKNIFFIYFVQFKWTFVNGYGTSATS